MTRRLVDRKPAGGADFTAGALLVAVLLSICSGCAMFKGNDLPAVTWVPPERAESARPSVSYVTTAHIEFGSRESASEDVQSFADAETRDVLEESGFFSRVAIQDEEADIVLRVTFTEKANAAALFPALLTAFSLYVIPSWLTTYYELGVDVDVGNGEMKNYTATDSTVLVQWLPMLFVYPFQDFSETAVEVRRNLYRTVLAEMQDDGVFEAVSD